MDQASVRPATVVEWDDGRSGRLLDDIAREEPLEICIAGGPTAVVMRTPGDDPELAAGFLFSEGVIERADDLVRLDSPSGARNRVDVELGGSAANRGADFARHFSVSSACGVCGRTSIEAVRNRQAPLNAHNFRIASRPLCELPAAVRDRQRVFARTGGLHAAALFDEAGEIVVVREDIGRHNAVDKIVGWALLSGRMPLDRYGLLVSGRGGFEIVQKAVVAGVPLVSCLSAPSSLAVQLAREAGQTLVGFLREKRFVIYAGEERIGDITGLKPCATRRSA